MEKIRTLLKSLDTQLLFIASVFLLIFIPLFPKIPLFDALPGYIVRVRIEDLLVFVTLLIWLREVFLKRVKLHSVYFLAIGFYAISGLLSLILGVFLLKSIPLELLHIGKSALHYFRYIEYFVLFLVFYSSIKTKFQVKVVIVLLSISVITIAVYGYGQQHWNFPLFSTMNREYSKGEALYLQEFARPQSTFAGHYDLGAYLAFVLPLLFSYTIYQIKNGYVSDKRISLLLIIAQLSGIWMLISSGAKTAVAAYAVGIGVVLVLLLSSKKSFKEQFMWGSIAAIGLCSLLFAIVQFSGESTRALLKSLSENSSITQKAYSVLSLEKNDALTEISDDRPSDLYGQGHEVKRVATESADGTTSYIDVPFKSTWSENALKYGISMGIRLDTLWPNAIKGFFANPLTGKGYGTLSKEESQQFTEADSTDNNYLRTLGETGILGFVTFFGILIIIFKHLLLRTHSKDQLHTALAIGFIASLASLLLNAVYIDVFAASKVAFTFWGLAGFIVATLQIKSSNKLTKEISSSKVAAVEKHSFMFEHELIYKIQFHLKKHLYIYLALVLLFFAIHQNPYANNSLLKNLGNSTEAIEQVVAANCFLEGFGMSICNTQIGTVLKPHVSLYSFIYLPFLKITNIPTAFYFANAAIVFASIFITYAILLFSLKKSPVNRDARLVLGLGSFILFTSFLLHSSNPFTTTTTLLILIVLPLVSSGIGFATATLTQTTERAVRNGFTMFLLMSIILSNAAMTLSTRFVNDQEPELYKAVERLNLSLDENFVIQNQSKPLLISALNPFFIDIYSNGFYESLPLSEHQEYFENARLSWGEYNFNNLHALYDSVMQSKQKLFISDYGISSDPAFQLAFDTIADSYQLRFHAIGCQETCNLYTVKPESKPISSVPNTINNFPLDLQSLSDRSEGYSFRIFSNRFGESAKEINHNTKFFGLRVADVSKSQADFTVITGDLGTRGDAGQWEYFLQLVQTTLQSPLFYSPGNFDLIEKKYPIPQVESFFTTTEVYVFIPVGANSEIDPRDQIDVYNALLQLEKMTSIKTVFIFAHDLNWQSKEEGTNFTKKLENRLARLENKSVHIFTALKTSDTASVNKNYTTESSELLPFVTYHSSVISGSKNDVFFEVSIDQSGTVLVEPKGFTLMPEQIMDLNTTTGNPN
ncbi:MAG: O-antigen ligase family protein [Microgenomates group bacterium]